MLTTCEVVRSNKNEKLISHRTAEEDSVKLFQACAAGDEIGGEHRTTPKMKEIGADPDRADPDPADRSLHPSAFTF